MWEIRLENTWVVQERKLPSKEKLVTPGIVSEVFPIFLYPFLIVVPWFLWKKVGPLARPTRFSDE